MSGARAQPPAVIPSCKIIYSMWIVIGCLCILYFGETTILPRLSRRLHDPASRVHARPAPQRGFLHFVLPAAKPDVNLCKALVSSIILDYPFPTLIGWDAPSDPSHLSKIEAVNTFLRTLNTGNLSDVILMVDSLDTWFQLPVSVLLSRYHATNLEAKARPTSAGYNQRIIFAAEKKCWPGDPESLACAQAPDPPLPKTLFGTQTDEQRDLDSSNPFQFMRPRYLNSGFLMGSVGDVRRLYRRAEEKVRRDGATLMTDQGVIGRVWAEQEVARAERRARGMATSRTDKGEISEGESAATDRKRRKRTNLADRAFKEPWYPSWNGSYGFGIGLDYAGALSLTTQWAWSDAEWIALSNVSEIQAAIDEFKVTDPRVRPGEIPSDLERAGPPFDILAAGNLSNTKWEDVKLYTNLWTGVIPASIHHNAMPDHENKLLRDSKWGSMWFTVHVREMLEARLKAAEGAGERLLAVDEDGKEWYSPGRGRRGVTHLQDLEIRTITQQGKIGWAKWSELCGTDVETEIFG